MSSAQLVKELREISGAGMMDCKNALVESKDNLEKALEFLRKSGIAKAQKKSGRSAKEGLIFSYIHPGAKLGVMLEINCETDFVANTDEFQNLAKDISMHIAAANPMSVIREDLAETLISKEKEIYFEQAKKSGKPDNIIEKMIEGRLNKFYKENVLMEQVFVKNQDQDIKGLVDESISKLGENILIKRFKRFQLGEKYIS